MPQTTYEEVSIGIETKNRPKETGVVQQASQYPKATPASVLRNEKKDSSTKQLTSYTI